MINHCIKEAQTLDALRLSQLTHELTPYIFEEEVPKWFEEELSKESFEKRILSTEYEHFVYVQENKIVGFIAIKDKNRLFHLFVDSRYHKKGIAKALWHYIKEQFDVSNMSVNASLYAIKTYESFGFIANGEQSEYLGLTYQPMKYTSFFIIGFDKKFLEQLVELFTNTIHNINKKDYSKEQLNAWANPKYDLKTWKKRVEKSKPYLCMLEDEVVGFCEYYEGYIDCFYVHFNYQNHGIGKLLLTYILDIAKNEKRDKLKVDASITAKPFFEKFGFKEVKKNFVKRENVELVNFSMEMNVKT
jgi:ribosomal protein S18 acetylase RimI-like enzyme